MSTTYYCVIAAAPQCVLRMAYVPQCVLRMAYVAAHDACTML
jgi:hypothetical protein